MPSLHINADKEDIAKHVIMPGDPLRAKFMAERYLEKPKLVNQIRNMLAYTGWFDQRLVTVMASGMGVPSMGIYSHELFSTYEVEAIIRVGTCGAIQPTLHLGDIILGQSVSTDSNYTQQFGLDGILAPTASWDLLRKATTFCERQHYPHTVGNILCSDIFYHAQPDSWKKWASMGVLAIEMESTALYANAAYHQKQALTLLTVSDQIVHEKRCSTEERERSFTRMVEIALHAFEAK